MKRIGIDVGGTFTDIVVMDEASGTLSRAKVPSVPAAPESGFMAALAKCDVPLDEVRALVHGTTIVTNLILERKGARVALITTKGFRDVLEIMRATRPLPYDLQWQKPQPLIGRDMCFEVEERIMASGKVATPIDAAAVGRVVDEILALGVDGIAVSLMHAYLDDSHEKVVERVIREKAPDLPLSISSVICREIREYERTNSTVANVYSMPRVKRYVAALEKEVDRPGLVSFLSSEGGIQAGAEAAARPISLCVSGPAGGVLGGSLVGDLVGRDNIVTVDMGGTSFDIAVIRGGRFEQKNTFEIEWGLPVKTPTIDIKTIGAGGGSIVWIDEGGALRVGPMSAGADPGPACYGRGGTECTVTDANLVLGLIHPDGLMPLDTAAAERVVKRVGDHFGVGTEEAAEGIYRVVNAAMAAAIRQVTVEKGIDPRDFALVPFGGAGGQHAAMLAKEVGIPEIILPNMPSVFSAFGMVSAPMKVSRAGAIMKPLGELTPCDLHNFFKGLAGEIETAALGPAVSERRLEYALDLRYLKQAHEITVVIDSAWPIERIVQEFKDRHEETFGTRLGHGVMAVAGRLTSIASLPPLEPASEPVVEGRTAEPVRLARLAGIADDVPVYDRETLLPGATCAGPCLVEEVDTTFYVPPGATGRVDPYRNLIVTV